MSRVDLLCEYCRVIPFDPGALSHTKKKSFSLGKWSHVRKSQCSFCRLFKLAAHEDYRTAAGAQLVDETNVSVVWAGSSGPGNRGAFYLLPTGDHWICFAANTDSAPTVEDSHFLHPVVHPELDVSRVMRWLSTCQSRHPGRCVWESDTVFTDAFPGLQVIRFVDVVQECLVEIQEVTRYVALSYIWGAVDNFRLTVANKPKLLLPGSITKLLDRIPTTIKDAIILVRKLGLRYLWVDALCLLQNDPSDLERGIQVMDLIYERSWLTIIAACGHNANAGLPGVYSESRKISKLTLEVKPGTSLGVYTSLDQLLKGTMYNSRAWTFQEHVLCRRALYFVDNKIFFRCSHGEFAESCADHTRVMRTDSSVASLLPDAVHMNEPLDDFSTMLLYYSQKVLTNEGDALRAMTGIMRRISTKLKTRFLQGLPTVALDAFIHFTKSKVSNLHRRPGFPSYSWAGWRGPLHIDVAFDDQMNDWLTYETWIVWYKRSPSGITNLVLDPATGEVGPIFGKIKMQSTANGYFKSALPLNISTVRTAPTENLPITASIPSYPLLQFWTMSTFYRLSDIDVFDGTCRLLGVDGSECGKMELDGFEESTFYAGDRPLEIILLSGLSPVNVMLIEWKGGIAERRGVGLLFHKALPKSFKPGPRWVEIVLG